MAAQQKERKEKERKKRRKKERKKEEAIIGLEGKTKLAMIKDMCL